MEPLLSLAFAMHSNPGVYALLLGSGISRAAAIPTGWEVVLDLVRKLATLKGETCDPDPEAWFVRTFGEAPTYSGILKRLCRTPAERQQLLRNYFEPVADDDPSGERQPTKAHHAIAALVKSGHVRVILTTNFDRLMERSLEAAGVSPVIISTADAVEGAMPLAHAGCTVVKLHGDYLDVRTKNTPEELAKYDRRIIRLLDKVFDEYGLVVCGWSSEWDGALRDAMFRCKSRRFTTFWAARGALVDPARQLVEHRKAEVVEISDADHFFDDVHQKVVSLAAFDPPHPLSAKTAVATMKRLLSDDRHRIELHDLVTSEVERVMRATSDEKMSPSGSGRDLSREVKPRLGQYEAAMAILLPLFVTAGRWSSPAHAELWVMALERLANRDQKAGGITLLLELRKYPAVLAIYASGLAATACSNFEFLRALLLEPRLRIGNGDGSTRVALERLYPQALLDSDSGSRYLTPGTNTYTPLNNHLFEVLREPLRDVLPSEEDYAEQFDRFEYLLALTYLHLMLAGEQTEAWFPLGRFSWRDRWHGDPPIFARVEVEAEAAGARWPAITSGLFPSLERFRVLAAIVKKRVAGSGWR